MPGMDDDDLDPTSPLDLSRAEVEYVGTRGGGTTPTKSMSFPCKVPLVATRVREEAGRREIMEESGLRPLLPLFPDTVAESATFFACRAQ
jgi:hypothetical protein